ISSTLIYSTVCERLDAQALLRSGATLPADFRPTSAARCTKSILGHVFDRTLFVQEVTQTGIVTRKRELTYSVNRDGEVVDAYYVDQLSIWLFACYVILLEWRFGRTLGKDIVYIRVRPRGSGSASLIQVLKRFVRFLPAILISVLLSFPSIVWAIISST